LIEQDLEPAQQEERKLKEEFKQMQSQDLREMLNEWEKWQATEEQIRSSRISSVVRGKEKRQALQKLIQEQIEREAKLSEIPGDVYKKWREIAKKLKSIQKSIESLNRKMKNWRRIVVTTDAELQREPINEPRMLCLKNCLKNMQDWLLQETQNKTEMKLKLQRQQEKEKKEEHQRAEEQLTSAKKTLEQKFPVIYAILYTTHSAYYGYGNASETEKNTAAERLSELDPDLAQQLSDLKTKIKKLKEKINKSGDKDELSGLKKILNSIKYTDSSKTPNVYVKILKEKIRIAKMSIYIENLESQRTQKEIQEKIQAEGLYTQEKIKIKDECRQNLDTLLQEREIKIALSSATYTYDLDNDSSSSDDTDDSD
jgi:hypothetical protein